VGAPHCQMLSAVLPQPALCLKTFVLSAKATHVEGPASLPDERQHCCVPFAQYCDPESVASSKLKGQ
jgi:hypothetical protein